VSSTAPEAEVDPICPTCDGGGIVTKCANDGTHGCSHVFDKEYNCFDCNGTGVYSHSSIYAGAEPDHDF
jgi:DnaJ-class molecular chaperone